MLAFTLTAADRPSPFTALPKQRQVQLLRDHIKYIEGVARHLQFTPNATVRESGERIWTAGLVAAQVAKALRSDAKGLPPKTRQLLSTALANAQRKLITVAGGGWPMVAV
jgi:hypothetical protein